MVLPGFYLIAFQIRFVNKKMSLMGQIIVYLMHKAFKIESVVELSIKFKIRIIWA